LVYAKQKLLKSNKISAIGLGAAETGKKLRLLVCREHRLPCPVSKKTPAGETKAGVSEARFSLEAYSITSGSTALSSLWNFASITFITNVAELFKLAGPVDRTARSQGRAFSRTALTAAPAAAEKLRTVPGKRGGRFRTCGRGRS
jgi:hypothetical protein